jgi:hypothetical protein
MDQEYNFLVRMLLRHYAKNRRRSWRSGPHDAFLDARIQVEGPLAVLIVSPLALANLILSRTIWPWLARIMFDKVTNGAAIVGLSSLAIFIAVDQLFGRYEFIPNIEAHFNTERDRNLVNIFFFGILSLIPMFSIGAFFVNKALPPVHY